MSISFRKQNIPRTISSVYPPPEIDSKHFLTSIDISKDKTYYYEYDTIAPIKAIFNSPQQKVYVEREGKKY